MKIIRQSKSRKLLSRILDIYNILLLKIINFLNGRIISKLNGNNKNILFNIQYLQRYSIIELIYANYLKHKGFNVLGMVCAGYDYCEQEKIFIEKPNCSQCRANTFKFLKAIDIESIDLKNHIVEEKEPCLGNKLFDKKIKKTNYPLGKTAYWNWLHYSNGYINSDKYKNSNKKLDDINKCTLGSYQTIRSALYHYRPVSVLTCNGIFAQTYPVYFFRNLLNYSCITWEHFFKGDNLVFLKNTLSMNLNIDNYWPSISKSKISQTDLELVTNNFQLQSSGSKLPFDFKESHKIKDNDKIIKELNLDSKKMIFSIFCNVSWDSPAFHHGVGNLDFFETLVYIVRNAEKYPNIQFIIRSHPAEGNMKKELYYFNTSISIADAICQVFNKLPKNIFLVDSGRKISSYSICNMSDECMFFSSTLGFEMAFRGYKITSLGGKAYYANKGFSNDLKLESDLQSFFDNAEKKFKVNGKRGKMQKLSEEEINKVIILSHYLQKTYSTLKIVKRGIINLNYNNFKSYHKFSENLYNYQFKDGTPFDLDS